MTCPLHACKVAYTGQVTFYKVPDKHGHVYLVRVYVQGEETGGGGQVKYSNLFLVGHTNKWLFLGFSAVTSLQRRAYSILIITGHCRHTILITLKLKWKFECFSFCMVIFFF